MKIKIKAVPDDFVVEEIAGLPYSNKGDFAVYLLKKINWNMFELLLKLSRECGLWGRI